MSLLEDDGIPSPVREAIWGAARDKESARIACQLFVEDANDSGPSDSIARGGLEHAVARAMLDAWLRGQSSAERVGSACAKVGDCVVKASRVG